MSIYVPCHSCKRQGRCSDENALNRMALWSFGRRGPSVDCASYVQSECSFAKPSPHPFRRHGIQDDSHGGVA